MVPVAGKGCFRSFGGERASEIGLQPNLLENLEGKTSWHAGSIHRDGILAGLLQGWNDMVSGRECSERPFPQRKNHGTRGKE